MKKILTTLFCFCLFITNTYAQLRVKSDGNVKIGTENVRPNGKLQITGSNASLELELFNESRLISRVWTLNRSYSFAFGVDSDGTGAIWKNANDPSNTKILHFNKNGNFGMGINSDNTYRLKVNGSVKANSFIVNSGNQDRTQSINKNKIDNICDLKTLSYVYNIKVDSLQQMSGHLVYGFDINNFEQYYPELVYRNDDEIGIDYISIIPILVAKINEQNNAINYLLAKSHADQHDIETADNTFHIIECYPNPFNQTTTIKYNLPDDVYKGSISIYNRFGNLVNYYDIHDKYGQIICDGTSMDAGLYICTFATDGEIHEVKTIIKKDL